MKLKYKCELCGKEQITKLGEHITIKHKIRKKEYFDQFLKTDTDGKCKLCFKNTDFDERRFKYKLTCSKTCAAKIARSKVDDSKKDYKRIFDKIKNTCKIKYGVENVFQSEIIKDKIKNENNLKYGVDYPAQNKTIYEKTKKTKKNDIIMNFITII